MTIPGGGDLEGVLNGRPGILEDDGNGISFQCLQSFLASNFDGTLVLKYSIWPGEWMEFPLKRKAHSLNMPMTLP